MPSTNEPLEVFKPWPDNCPHCGEKIDVDTDATKCPLCAKPITVSVEASDFGFNVAVISKAEKE